MVGETPHQFRLETRLLALLHHREAGLADFDAHAQRGAARGVAVVEGAGRVRPEPVGIHLRQAAVLPDQMQEFVELAGQRRPGRLEGHGHRITDQGHRQFGESRIAREQRLQAGLGTDDRVDLAAAERQTHRRQVLVVAQFGVREGCLQRRTVRKGGQHADPPAGELRSRADFGPVGATRQAQ